MSGCGKHWSGQIPLTFFLLHNENIYSHIFIKDVLSNKLHVKSLVEIEGGTEAAFGESYLATVLWGPEFLGLSGRDCGF